MSGFVIGTNEGYWGIVGKYRRDSRHFIGGYEEIGLNYVLRQEPSPN
jgi:hypothetical protein